MKKILLLISVAALALFASSNASAQGKFGPDSANCIKYLSYYSEYYKQKNYDAALPNWRQAYKYCPPTARYSLLQDGTTMIKRLINKNQNNPEYKQKLLDSLTTLYNQRVQHWPKYKISSLNNMALDMFNYIKDDNKKLYAILNDVVEQNKEKTKVDIFPLQLNLAITLYKEGVIGAEEVINIYENAIGHMGNITPKNDTEAAFIEQKVSDVEALFVTSQVASCENVVALFTPKFEADPNNLDLAKTIVKLMGSTEGCTDNDLFLGAINTMHSQEPSHTSAYYLYKLYSGRNDIDNAIKFMQEAIDSEVSDPAADAAYNFELAAFCLKNGKNALAIAAAEKALELDPAYAGRAYMLIGTIWGSIVCPGNDIEQRAKYWVAVDYMMKAKNADETLAEDANEYIRQYAAFYPQTAEAFMFDITDGQSYTVSCNGMRAVTTVRTQK